MNFEPILLLGVWVWHYPGERLKHCLWEQKTQMTAITPLRDSVFITGTSIWEILVEYSTAVHNTERINRYVLPAYSIISSQSSWSYEVIAIQAEGFALILQTSWERPLNWGAASQTFSTHVQTLTSLKNGDAVFPLPYAQVSCVGKHCLFHAKAMLFAIFFASSLEHFQKDWRRIGKQPELDAVTY